MLFSQRKGLKPVEKLVQSDDIDIDLKNGLWSATQICYWDNYSSDYPSLEWIRDSNLEDLFVKYWIDFFKSPIDTLPTKLSDAKRMVRKYFFGAEWNEIYDFIEFTANNGPEKYNITFKEQCNNYLEKENSAYRFVDSVLVEISSEEEIESIEDAISSVSKFSGIKAHLNSAVLMLSDRKNPDYRNSIKESISAVEAISQLITNDKKATLGKLLKY
jgi:hypothetical protein